MSDTDPETAQWLWDEVPHYRLNDEIIHKYLSEHWEGYNFYIEVNASSPSALKFHQHCAAKRREIQVLGSAKTQKGTLSMGTGRWPESLASNVESDRGLGREGCIVGSAHPKEERKMMRLMSKAFF